VGRSGKEGGRGGKSVVKEEGRRMSRYGGVIVSGNYNGTPPEITDNTRGYSLTAYHRLLPRSTNNAST
jgi:hypothetical protein